MRYSCRSFIGHNPDHSWSQYWEGGADNSLSCLINISSFSVDLPQIGREILETLPKIFDATTLQSTLELIIANPKYSSLEISLSLALVQGDSLTVAQLNSGQIFLHRGSNLANLIEGQPGKISLASGQIADGDRLLFVSDKFFTQFPLDYLRSTLSLTTVSAIEEAVLGDLVNLDDQNLTSAALIEFEQDQPQPVEVETTPAPLPTPPTHEAKVSHLPIASFASRRKIRLVIGIIILFLFVGSVIFTSRQNQAKKLETQYLALETQIQQSIDQSIKLKPLNLESSRQEAQKAQDLLTSIKLLKVHSDKVESLEKSISELLTTSGSSEYSPEFYFDTSLIAGQKNFTFLRSYSSKLYLLDPADSKLFELSISEKNHRLISDDSALSTTIDFAVDKNITTLLSPKTISVLKDGKPSGSLEFKDLVPTHFHMWNSAAYFLTSDSIYKSAPNSTAFSAPQNWLKTGNNLPANTTSISINGSIWTITASGSITSFTQGVKDKNIPSLNSEIKSASRLQAAPDYDKLVFTDGDNIVYIYNKAGESVSKFNYGDKKILDIALDPPSNTVFVLCSDQKIYKINL